MMFSEELINFINTKQQECHSISKVLEGICFINEGLLGIEKELAECLPELYLSKNDAAIENLLKYRKMIDETLDKFTVFKAAQEEEDAEKQEEPADSAQCENNGTEGNVEYAGAGVSMEDAGAGVSMENAGADVSVENAGADVSVENAGAGVSVEGAGADVSVEDAGAGVSMEGAGAGVSVEYAGADDEARPHISVLFDNECMEEEL